MKLEGKNIGLCVTGSFCNFDKLEPVINSLKKENVNKIIPITSFTTITDINRFSNPDSIKEKLKSYTGSEIVDTIALAEPIGPKALTDILLVLPCTGNTIAKVANGITDTPVLMAIKSHIRQNKPVVIAVSTNDGLGANAENIGKLLNVKNFYFVPFSQDNPSLKPKSVVCNYSKVIETLEMALDNIQFQPVLD